MRDKLISGLAGAAFILSASGSGFAADLPRKAPVKAPPPPPAPVYSWTGFYIGGNGGYAWSESSDQLANFNNVNLFHGLSPKGGFGGGQIGYNWQGLWHPQLVLGVEADFQGAGIRDSATWVPFGQVTAVSESKLDWFGTVRGRLGYAFDSVLVYATGGFAYGHVHNSQADNRPIIFTVERTATGYAVGGGVEYKFAPAWSVKAEYQFINLGKNDPVSAIQGSFTSFQTKLNDDAYNTFRVGLNYQFH
jgi:outer membrane immunogenic protein